MQQWTCPNPRMEESILESRGKRVDRQTGVFIWTMIILISLSCVKRKSAFEHAQNAKIKFLAHAQSIIRAFALN